MTDPIADMLTRIRNALTAHHDAVEIPGSNMKRAIANILLEEGYVKNVEFVEDGLSGIYSPSPSSYRAPGSILQVPALHRQNMQDAKIPGFS